VGEAAATMVLMVFFAVMGGGVIYGGEKNEKFIA
jgi:hypothetical protein